MNFSMYITSYIMDGKWLQDIKHYVELERTKTAFNQQDKLNVLSGLFIHQHHLEGSELNTLDLSKNQQADWTNCFLKCNYIIDDFIISYTYLNIFIYVLKAQ